MRELIIKEIIKSIENYNERWAWADVQKEIPDFSSMTDKQVLLTYKNIMFLNSQPIG